MGTTVQATVKPEASGIRDFATAKGTYRLEETSVGRYLDLLRLYDPKTRMANWDPSITAAFQRAVLPIGKNPIKRRMLRDLLRGGTLPPIVLYDRGENRRPTIVDGLQRTDVQTHALRALLTLEREEKLEDFVKQELDAMKVLTQAPISVDEFLERPLAIQVWRDLSPDELVRLFMILNVGQQKVSPRHLLEVMGTDLRRMFEDWGLKLVTEREEVQHPRRRGRHPSVIDEDDVIPGMTHFRYEYLLDGLVAYVTRNPQVKTTEILQQKAETADLDLDERVTEIGSEFCRADFVWVCRDLNKVIQERYKDDPRWRVAIQKSDNFFIPLMAALGDGRHSDQSRPALEDRKAKLIELVRGSDDQDPLWLSRSDSDGLGTILDGIGSNIGRRRRGVVYNAWRRYFRLGPVDPTYPVEWRTALLSE